MVEAWVVGSWVVGFVVGGWVAVVFVCSALTFKGFSGEERGLCCDSL